ncbi:Uncharacterised protein [Ewingella americana]|uniref:Uncharacterized protein n=1 Tax=Ewingella americana TaxID=41202 RepID=A0A377NEN1_9GAMM|nr:Uncharacterised protein [Ewingella americana]
MLKHKKHKMTLLAACVGASSLAVSIPGWAQNNGEEETLTVTADGSSTHGEGYVANRVKPAAEPMRRCWQPRSH